MKTINLKQVLSGLARVLFISSGLCILLGSINGILRNSWDVFSIGLMGLVLFCIIGTLYGIIELIVQRFTSQRTLDAIFKTPDPITLKWWQVESLLKACGAKSIRGKASTRVKFELNGVTVTFHRPHSQKEAHPYQVRDARRFLEEQR